MRVDIGLILYFGLIILTAYYCHSRLSPVEYNCALIKVDWLAVCIELRVVGAVLGSFSSSVSSKAKTPFKIRLSKKLQVYTVVLQKTTV
jgi:hypothetical protein